MAEKDDNPEIMSNTQFFARTTDPDPYTFTAAEDGKYLIQVTSRESSYQYGPRVDVPAACRPAASGFPRRRHAGQQLRPGRDRPAGRWEPELLERLCFPLRRLHRPDRAGRRRLASRCHLSAAGHWQRRSGPVRWSFHAAPTAARFNGPITIKATATVNGKPRRSRGPFGDDHLGRASRCRTLPTITRLDADP